MSLWPYQDCRLLVGSQGICRCSRQSSTPLGIIIVLLLDSIWLLLLSRLHSGGFAGLGLLDILISWISKQCLAHIDVIHVGEVTDGGSISKSTSIASLWDDRAEGLQTFAEQLRDRASLLEDS
ncbi:hypothetical protein CRENBAI_006159 [Crenichthys baileyi]|uniref:Uncharacterized protein n=1 Tax=Crenichthys baileyi TaxID=28760 RepID=A0AAV9QSG2_9TELE